MVGSKQEVELALTKDEDNYNADDDCSDWVKQAIEEDWKCLQMVATCCLRMPSGDRLAGIVCILRGSVSCMYLSSCSIAENQSDQQEMRSLEYLSIPSYFKDVNYSAPEADTQRGT